MLRPNVIAPGVKGFAALTPTLPPATHTNSYALGTRDLLLVEPATLRLPELAFERRLEDGEVITLDGPESQRWEVLHTPGHAPGHLCLLERQSGHLLASDMVASEGTILIEPGDGDMAVYLTQMERLAALGARRVLPAHGTPVEDPARLFRFYIAHRLEREAKVRDALCAAGAGGATPEALVPIAYRDTPRQAWPLAALSLEAHLLKLVHDGVARVDGRRYVST